MQQDVIQVKVPGKLMVAGEFAVLEPYYELLAMAVDRFVYATITPAKQYELTLENFDLKQIPWSYNSSGYVQIESTDHRVRFVQTALSIVCQFLLEQGYDIPPFALKIDSQLDDVSGRKYGLGSSAAVVTVTIEAVLKYAYQKHPSLELIFKLASIAHVKTQGNGSGADVAASTYGGVVKYTSFQAEWLLDELKKTARITDLVEKNWTYLSIKPVTLPDHLSLFIGWTGSPASTYDLVNRVGQLKEKHPEHYETFLTQSKLAVELILKGIKQNEVDQFLEGIKQNRRCLALLGKHADTEIETPLLTALCEIAEALGGAGKPSGAGGGDCGIAFIPQADPQVEADLKLAWEQAGIVPLDLQLYEKTT